LDKARTASIYVLYTNISKSCLFRNMVRMRNTHSALFPILLHFTCVLEWKCEEASWYQGRHVMLFLYSAGCKSCHTRGISNTSWTSSSIPQSEAWKCTSPSTPNKPQLL